MTDNLAYRNSAGETVEHYTFAEVLGTEHGWLEVVPRPYVEAFRALARYVDQTKSLRPMTERFRVGPSAQLEMSCRSKHATVETAKAAAHEFGAFFTLDQFSLSNVARGVHVCKDCVRKAGRTHTRPSRERAGSGPEPERFFVIPAQNDGKVSICKTMD